MMKLRWVGDDKSRMRGTTALDCLRHHCHGDHSPEGCRGDVDGVMRRITSTFALDVAYASLPTLEERTEAFVKTAIDGGILFEE